MSVITDSDLPACFIINPITRTITNPGCQKTKLMRTDHDSERFTFEVPKVIEGQDISECARVQIHYNNIDSATKVTHHYVYDVTDMAEKTGDPDTLTFSWLISECATHYAGLLNFMVRFEIGNVGAVTYRWNSGIYKSIEILDAIDNNDLMVAPYPGVLTTMQTDITNAENRITAMETNVGIYHEGDPIITSPYILYLNQEIRCVGADDDWIITSAPSLQLPILSGGLGSQYYSTVIFKAPNNIAPVITNPNTGEPDDLGTTTFNYPVKYSGMDIDSGAFAPVAGKLYRMSFVFDGMFINCYVSGVTV